VHDSDELVALNALELAELLPVEALPVHPTPYTLHPTPCILDLTPYTLHPTADGACRTADGCGAQRDFFIDNLLVRIHFIIVMIRWTGLVQMEHVVRLMGAAHTHWEQCLARANMAHIRANMAHIRQRIWHI